MPSDTFAAGIEAAVRNAVACLHDSPPKAWPSYGDLWVEDITTAVIAVLTPTDTDTAIPAGVKEAAQRVQRRVGEWDKLQGHEPRDRFAAFGENMRHDAMSLVAAVLAASPKPDTDTPVDPGVEGVRLALKRLQFSADFQRAYGSDDVRVYRADLDAVLALAAKPIAGMDAGERKRVGTPSDPIIEIDEHGIERHDYGNGRKATYWPAPEHLKQGWGGNEATNQEDGK